MTIQYARRTTQDAQHSDTPAPQQADRTAGLGNAAAAAALYDSRALAECSDNAVAAVDGLIPRKSERESARPYAEANVPRILTEAAEAEVRLSTQAAYILATAFHETKFGTPRFWWSETLIEDNNLFKQAGDGTWFARHHLTGKTVRGKTKEELEVAYWDMAYGHKLDNEQGSADGRDYRGRGLVQLTGRENYRDMSKHLNDQGYTYTHDGVEWGGPDRPIDLLANPHHVNEVPDLAARILVEGTMEGSFTPYALGDYVNEGKTDYRNARRVINGDVTKNGETVAKQARTFQRALDTRDGWKRVFAPAEGVDSD